MKLTLEAGQLSPSATLPLEVQSISASGLAVLTSACAPSDLDQSDRILDVQQRARVLNRADDQMARDVPTIPLFEVPLMVAVRSTVRNFKPSGFNDPTWDAENWWLER